MPFTFLPHETSGDATPPPPPPKTKIEPDKAKEKYEITWPNIVRINYTYKTRLEINFDTIDPLTLDAKSRSLRAELANIIEGKPDITQITSIELEDLTKKQRMQKYIFEAARDIFDQMNPQWEGNQAMLIAQLVNIVEQFMHSPKLIIVPTPVSNHNLRKKLVIMLYRNYIFQHLWNAIKHTNQDNIELIFDRHNPIRSTANMTVWYTARPCEPTKKSHINFCVFDSTWESSEMFALDNNPEVTAWTKNDHLGFEILYIYQGIVKKYRPDFIVKMKDGRNVILETKGQTSLLVKAKEAAAKEWAKAVTEDGRFGKWRYAISSNPRDVEEVLRNAG